MAAIQVRMAHIAVRRAAVLNIPEAEAAAAAARAEDRLDHSVLQAEVHMDVGDADILEVLEAVVAAAGRPEGHRAVEE